MMRSTLRVARKFRRCESCRGPIQPGATYCESVISPHHADVGNVGWWRAAECEECGVRAKREPLP